MPQSRFGRCADPHQDQRARHGASPGLHGLHRRARPSMRRASRSREQRFLGLYTSSAYNRRPWDIPLVRERYEHVMRESGLRPASHSGKALRHIVETLPRDELFQSSEAELFDTASGILGLQERVRSKLFLRRDRYGRFYSVLVYVPRDRHDTRMRRRIEAMLKRELDGEHVDTNVHIGESPLAQLHLIVRPRAGSQVQVDEAEARRRTGARSCATGRTNSPKNSASATAKKPACDSPRATAARCRPVTSRTSARRSPRPTSKTSRSSPVPTTCACRCTARTATAALRFKFYRLNDDIPLSDALPMMENMGLRVISEHPYRIESNGDVAYIQDFEVEATQGDIDIDRLDENFEEAFARIWRGEAENDALQPPGADGRPVVAPGRDAARLLQVHPADRRAVLAELRRGDVLALSAAGAPAGRIVRSALRSVHRRRIQGRDQAGHGTLRRAVAGAAGERRRRASRGAAGHRRPRRHARAAGRRHARGVARPDRPRRRASTTTASCAASSA